MCHRLIAFTLSFYLAGCGASESARTKHPASRDFDDSPSSKQTSSSPPHSQTAPKSETSEWSQVQSLESAPSGSATTKRKSQIVVSSDPVKHGDSLHFRFLVNSVPISGVFVASGGTSTTFTIPVGTVHFTVDECGWEAQGFELLPDEQLPIACKITKEGDCCEVAIPDDEKSAQR